jgi:hypothetical protein
MKKISPFNCSIGIVTYLGRFDKYFKPLMKQLHLLFPDYDINVFINGHYDTLKQAQYLKAVTAFLQNYPNTCYLTNIEHQSLARAWNWLVLMARCNRVLLLNDDVSFKLSFRYYLEKLQPIPEIFTLNKTWSHVVVSKDIIRKVGWFDERFMGVGFEDTDYVIRLARKGIPLEDREIHGLLNLHDGLALPEDTGWADISGLTLGKYSQINWEFFKKKWGVGEGNPESDSGGITIPAVGVAWHLKPDAAMQEVPEFYPLDSLNQAGGRKLGPGMRVRGKVAQAVSWLGSKYWQARLAVGAWLCHLLGPRLQHWRRTLDH